MSLERKASSVNFSRPSATPEPTTACHDEDDLQIGLAPRVQTYLAMAARQREKEARCCRCLPTPFERAATGAWCYAHFDSDILEEQFKTSAFPQLRTRFRYALLYVLLVSVTLFVYFLYRGLTSPESTASEAGWPAVCSVLSALMMLMAVLYTTTRTETFRAHFVTVSFCVALLLFVLDLCFVSFDDDVGLGSAGHFSICIEVILLVYTVVPVPLYASVSTCALYSIGFEMLNWLCSNSGTIEYQPTVRFLSQLCIHLIGVHIHVMTNVRMRGTFMKVGQSLLVRQQLEMEKQLKEKMIHSVMPPKLADWLIRDDNFAKNCEPRASNPETTDLRSLFRPFNMVRMENVSILFADIVGFTKMSSNKSAEELVGILNDLFERFDHLCAINGCEKISTLGDCYYCVSGCPEPNPEHARCCVEMGLGMIQAIKQFDAERGEGVNMRVGVHTGTVLCGIVGTRRFKFDVWSNDVTLANKMESTGKPGMVHVSERTRAFLGDAYQLEDGDDYSGLRTYFILGRAPVHEASPNNGSLTTASSVPASPSPSLRPRVINKSPRQLSPGAARIKASSLPSILDSEIEDQQEEHHHHRESQEREAPAAPVKTNRRWRIIPRFLRRNGASNNNSTATTTAAVATATVEEASGYRQVPAIVETGPWGGDDGRNDIIDVKSYISQSRSDVGQFDYSPGAAGSCGGVAEFGACHFLRTGSYRSQGARSPCDSTAAAIDRAAGEIGRKRSATMGGRIEVAVECLEVPGKHIGECASVNSRKDSGIRSNSRRSSIQPGGTCGGADDGNCNGEDCGDDHGDEGCDPDGGRNEEHRVSGYYTSSQSSLRSAAQLAAGGHLQRLRKQSDLQMIRCVQNNSRYFTQPPASKLTLCFRHRGVEHAYRAAASPVGYNTQLDVLVSAAVLAAVTTALFADSSASALWLAALGVAVVIQAAASALCLAGAVGAIGWYGWHALGACVVALPGVLAALGSGERWRPFLVGLVHFCNLTQLNCWLKNAVAFGVTIAFFLLRPTSEYNDGGGSVPTALLLVLVCFLNREFEIAYRLSFYANYVADRHEARVQTMKNQADWLLHNIIPRHVADQLKRSANYSENHRNVGIIFASIVNFNEMYDESFEGGKEYLRVLNELIGDFDELLTQPEFRQVDKIKTIGPTYMAASGLNPETRRDDVAHLHALLDFAVAMQAVVDSFNRDLPGFDLVLRVGYNHGDVTAGVIGTTKLYYDIWGDAVNIASRMDSTGVDGRVQLGAACLPLLEDAYEFERRGSVYVKGKDDMDVYLLQRRKNPTPPILPN